MTYGFNSALPHLMDVLIRVFDIDHFTSSIPKDLINYENETKISIVHIYIELRVT